MTFKYYPESWSRALEIDHNIREYNEINPNDQLSPIWAYHESERFSNQSWYLTFADEAEAIIFKLKFGY